MLNRTILIYLAIFYEGDYNQILSCIEERKVIDIPEDFVEPPNTLTIFDEEYPEYLRSLYRPPLVLFYKGNISLINKVDKNIAIIGSRKCSMYGEAVTKDIVFGLSSEYRIVSGLARGIDTLSHTCALNHKLKTIAVLPSGIDYCYPSENKELYDAIAKKGLVISEYPGSVPPKPTNFHMRNRLIAFFSKAVLITEAYMRSGTSITAGWALEVGRDVLVVPHNVYKDSFCNDLIRQGGLLVRNAKDVMEALNIEKSKPLFSL